MTNETSTKRAPAQRRSGDKQSCGGAAAGVGNVAVGCGERGMSHTAHMLGTVFPPPVKAAGGPDNVSGDRQVKRFRVSIDLVWPDTSPPVAIGVRWLLKRFLRTYAARCLTVSIGPADPQRRKT